jgi:hypothetical protein
MHMCICRSLSLYIYIYNTYIYIYIHSHTTPHPSPTTPTPMPHRLRMDMQSSVGDGQWTWVPMPIGGPPSELDKGTHVHSPSPPRASYVALGNVLAGELSGTLEQQLDVALQRDPCSGVLWTREPLTQEPSLLPAPTVHIYMHTYMYIYVYIYIYIYIFMSKKATEPTRHDTFRGPTAGGACRVGEEAIVLLIYIYMW